MYFGAHVSIAGGVFNAPLNAAAIGCEVFQFFTRSPHGGPVNPLTKAVTDLFKENCRLTAQKEWYVHAPYFINFASANNRIRYGSISILRQELERGSALGAKYLMTHLGSYKDLGKKRGFAQLVEGLQKTLLGYSGSTQLLLENSAGAGSGIGDNFEELAEIIHHPRLKKYQLGVCLDTQHAFASGYDWRTPKTAEASLKKFDVAIELKNLKMLHGNDSKVEFNSHKDRHEHIGRGQIGRAGFELLLSIPQLTNKNFILETEHDKIKEDLKIFKEIRKGI